MICRRSRESVAVFRDQRRIEAAATIAPNRQLHRPFRRQHRFRAAAIAVIGQAGFGLAIEMNIHLGIEHALRQRLLQIADQAA
jgi:hypothetical protein